MTHEQEDAKVYLLISGFGADIYHVNGPYASRESAELAKDIKEGMEFHEGGMWGEGDTWVKVEERELIQ